MTAPPSLNVREIRACLKPLLALCDSALLDGPPTSELHSLTALREKSRLYKAPPPQDGAQRASGAPQSMTGTCWQPRTYSALPPVPRPSPRLGKGSNEAE